MMVVYMSEKHLFCTVRKEKEKKPYKSLSCGMQKELIVFKFERQKTQLIKIVSEVKKKGSHVL